MQSPKSLVLIALLPVLGLSSLFAADATWTWGKEVTPEQRTQLTPVRDELQKKLAALGPRAAERLAALPTLTPKEAKELEAAMRLWQYRPANGDGGAIRERRRDEAVKRFGLKLYLPLMNELKGKSFWTRRVASQVMAILKKKHASVGWILYHHDVPTLQIDLIDDGPWAEQVGLRREVDASLRAITGQNPLEKLRASLKWKDAQVNERTTMVQDAWRRAWKIERARWEKAEQKRSAQRKALRAKLEQVRQGKLPTTD